MPQQARGLIESLLYFAVRLAEQGDDDELDQCWEAIEEARLYLATPADAMPAESLAGPGAPPARSANALGALRALLADVEASVACSQAYGMPVSNPDHPFHRSVTQARRVVRGETARLPTAAESISEAT